MKYLHYSKRELALLCLLLSASLFTWSTTRTTPLPYDEFFRESRTKIETYHGPKQYFGLKALLIWEANHGRIPITSDGKFIFPNGVNRVWLDIGAHMLETTRKELFESEDLAIIAVEPQRSCWTRWPKRNNLISLPFALNNEEGTQTFYLSDNSALSSLAQSAEGVFHSFTKASRSTQVEVYRLDRILTMIEPHLSIELLKVDVQGKDLQVLQSGGEQLRRIKKIIAEVNLGSMYEGDGGTAKDPEDSFIDLLTPLGFEKTGATYYKIRGQPAYANVVFENQLFD